MLHKLKNDTTGSAFCGPVAVGIITGKPLSRVLNEFRIVRHGRSRKTRPIRGTHTFEVIKVLTRLGWEMIPYGQPTTRATTGTSYTKPLTVAAWLRSRKGPATTQTFLLSIGGKSNGHWIVVRGRKMADTHTRGEPVFIGKAPHRRKHVNRVYRVEKIRSPKAP